MNLLYPKDFTRDDQWSSLIFAPVVNEPARHSDGTPWEQHMPLGYVLIIEQMKLDPFFKLPAGHKELGETPQETAAREFQGEVGIHQPLEKFEVIPAGCEWRNLPQTDRSGPHWSLLFRTVLTISQVKMLHEHDVGNEGEVSHYFPMDEFRTIWNQGWLLPMHKQRLVKANLVWPEAWQSGRTR